MVKPTVADECGLTQVEIYTREYIHEIHKKESRQIKTYFNHGCILHPCFNQIEILTKCNKMNNVNVRVIIFISFY